MNIEKQLLKETNNKQRFILSERNSFALEIVNKKLLKTEENYTTSIDIDVIFDKKRMEKSVNKENFDLNKEIKKLKKLSKYKNTPFYDEFPKTKKNNYNKILDENILNFSRDNLKEIYNKLNYVQDKIKKTLKNQAKTITTYFNFDIIKSTFISNDIYNKDLFFNFEIAIYMSHKDKTESEIGFEKDYLKIDSIDYDTIVNEVLDKTAFFKNQKEKNINLKNYDIIFEPEVYSNIFSVFIFSQLNIENKIKKDNFLFNNFEVDKKLNIISNPFVENSPFSRGYDDDFIATNKKYIIKNGKIDSYLAGLDYAFKYNVEPTGNSNNYLGNIEIKKGTKSLKNLFANTKKGFFVKDILGLHTTNKTEGKLNLILDGTIIENGEKKESVKNIVLNDNFKSLFTNIELSKETKRIKNLTGPHIFCRR